MQDNLSAHPEWHTGGDSTQLNWLRAAVLGANDGIVSVAAVVVGVVGAAASVDFILTAGIAALVGGALSMAVGEYVSVSTQRDTEKALLKKERFELDNYPEQELEELADIYQKKGLSSETAHVVARELTANDAFAAHVDAELGIDPHDLTNPWHAAYASAASFLVGGLIPLAMVFAPENIRIVAIFAGVLIALAITGSVSAYVGGANKTTATVRNLAGGALAMLITFGVGKLFGIVGL